MSKITKITKQKKHNNLYNIFVDDTFYCSLSDLELSVRSLRIGQILTNKELKDLQSTSEYNKTYSRALYYLQYGPRSEYQMRIYLLQRGYTQSYIDKAISQLIADNYINDLEYAKSFVMDRQLYKLKSNSYITTQLIKKGISRDVIEESLEQEDLSDQGSLIKIVTIKKYHQSAKYQDRQKMTQYLLRQGFKYSDISKALEETGLVFGSHEEVYNNSY